MTATRHRAESIRKQYRIVADPKKGELRLYRADDGLKYLQWSSRTSDNEQEKALIIFPGNQTFTKVDTGVKTDRVYLLQFKDSPDRRFFFWMQEPNESDDEKNVTKFNVALGNSESEPSTTAGSALGANGSPSDSTTEARTELNENVNDIMSAIMASLRGSGAQQQKLPLEQRLPLSLVEMFRDPNVAKTLLDNPSVCERLLPLLPTELSSPEELRHTLTSPQFLQGLQRLGSALRSQNYSTVMANFKLNPRAGQTHMERGDSVGAFLACLQADVDARTTKDDGAAAADQDGKDQAKHDE